MRYRSTPDYIEMAMIRQNATAEELSLRPPMVVGDPDFAIRVNRGLFGQAIADSELAETLAPLAVKLFGSRFVEKALLPRRPKQSSWQRVPNGRSTTIGWHWNLRMPRV